MKLTIYNKIRLFLSFPFLICHLLLYLISRNRRIINSDILAWGRYRDFISKNHMFVSLASLLVFQPEFREQFNLRIGRLSLLLVFFNNRGGYCDLGRCPFIGEGFVLIHGFGTVINGSAVIGKNCTILHNVTIGAGKGGSPVIGDNVYVGAGAIIIGNVIVGNNVKIGAGAIVVENVPDGSTVVSQKSKIICR